MRRHRRPDADAEINVTPMLDVVFILLIFFIVTTSFVKELGVEVARPADQPAEQRDIDEVIAIRIDASGAVFVDNRPVDIRAVQANVQAGLAGRAETPVVVMADRAADAGLMVRVIDQARLAGAERVSIASARN